jgi:hypothetical protein
MRRAAFIVSAVLALTASAHADESELRIGLKRTSKTKKSLDLLAGDAALAEQHLGKGMRIVPLGTQHLPTETFFDTADDLLHKQGARLRVRQGGSTLQLKLPPKGSGVVHKIEIDRPNLATGASKLLIGDLIGQGHPFGGGGINPAALEVSMRTGGQRIRYGIEQDGKRVGEVELANDFFASRGKKAGFGSLRYTGSQAHGQKLVDHLGVNKPVAAKVSGAAKLLGKR